MSRYEPWLTGVTRPLSGYLASLPLYNLINTVCLALQRQPDSSWPLTYIYSALSHRRWTPSMLALHYQMIGLEDQIMDTAEGFTAITDVVSFFHNLFISLMSNIDVLATLAASVLEPTTLQGHRQQQTIQQTMKVVNGICFRVQSNNAGGVA